MACYQPIKGYRRKDGSGRLTTKITEGYQDLKLEVKCGTCIGCRVERQTDWAIRAMHEAQMHEASSFVTLTYDDEHLPEDHGLVLDHWQRFAKKLRKEIGPFRFLHCGEYGAENLRPHYHALIFGTNFPDSIALAGSQLRISAVLADKWNHGFHSVGELTFASAKYVAKYVTKKLIGKDTSTRYERLDITTGEVWDVRPEYATMSRRPGLGRSWFEKYNRDVYPGNFVIVDGKKYKPPAYYDSLLETQNPQLAKKMKTSRKNKIKKEAWNHTTERMEIREEITRRQLKEKTTQL